MLAVNSIREVCSPGEMYDVRCGFNAVTPHTHLHTILTDVIFSVRKQFVLDQVDGERNDTVEQDGRKFRVRIRFSKLTILPRERLTPIEFVSHIPKSLVLAVPCSRFPSPHTGPGQRSQSVRPAGSLRRGKVGRDAAENTCPVPPQHLPHERSAGRTHPGHWELGCERRQQRR